MRYFALAADYDGTLASQGLVDAGTIAALKHLVASGRKLIVVTGRELDDLLAIFPEVKLLCERVVAENGALLYRPATQEEKLLATRPPEAFIQQLRIRGVSPLAVGRIIVATREPYESVVLDVIRELGLELQVIFNKGAVMVLPAGVNKATGLAAALEELGLSPHNVAAIGDAENDHALLRFCEFSAAVANALPLLKESADLVTKGDHGAGVVELINELVADDLRARESCLTRHQILLGNRDDGREVRISPYGLNLLLAGTSGSGKSTLATGILERLSERGYQFCIIDPEGDYEAFEDAVILGSAQRVPTITEVLQLLEKPDANAVVNLIGLPLQDRPSFFLSLLPRLQELRARTGRPHWILVDEAHHLLPSAWDPASVAISQELSGMILITVHPDQVSPAVLTTVDIVIAVGESPGEILKVFATAIGRAVPSTTVTLGPGQALMWSRQDSEPPIRLRIAPSRLERRRHRRKYAHGELGPDKSFYFQGPEGKLRLRAQNLILFLQIADGVDDATWTYHLSRGDYSRWFRDAIKDQELAAEAERIERLPDISPTESRQLIRSAIERHYTLPASSALTDRIEARGSGREA